MKLYRVLIVACASLCFMTTVACAQTPQKAESNEKSTRIELTQMDENEGIVIWEEEYEETMSFIQPSGPVQFEPDETAPTASGWEDEMPTYISNLTLREFDIYRQTDDIWKNIGRIEERGCAVMSVCTVMSGYGIDSEYIYNMVRQYKSGGCAPVAMFTNVGISCYYFTGISEKDVVSRMLKGEIFIIHEGPGRWTDSSHYMPLLDIRTHNGRYEVYVGNTINYGKTGWVSLSSVLAEAQDGYGIYSQFMNQSIYE